MKDNRFWGAPASFFVIGFLLYSNSLRGEFLGDDYKYVVDNVSIRNVADLHGIWVSCNTRFLVGLSYALNYRLGRWDVLGYHILNVVSHIAATGMVYWFVRLLFETPALRQNPLRPRAPTLALFSALIFLTHPIQTQAVSYIMQRACSMATITYLGTLAFYIRFRIHAKPRDLVAALVFMALGLVTKEMMVTVVVMLGVCEFFFFGPRQEDTGRRIRKLIPFFVVLGLFPIILQSNRLESVSQIKFVATLERFDVRYVWTEMNVLRTYLRLLFFPVHQSCVYNYPVAQHFFEGPVLMSFSLLVSLAVMAAVCYRRRRLFSFAVVWFFITTSVEAGAVILGNRDVIYEHWLYLPMVGFAIFLTTTIGEIFQTDHKMKAVLVGIIVVFSGMTYQRNAVWQNEITLWKDVLKKFPDKQDGYLALGVAYQRKKMYPEAYGYYQRAIQRFQEKGKNPVDYNAAQRIFFSRIYNNLGAIHYVTAYDPEAIGTLQQSLEFNPNNFKAHHLLGKVYRERKEYAKAIDCFQASLNLQRDQPDVYRDLGLAYRALGRTAEAQQNLETARRLFERYDEPDKAEGIRKLIERK